MIKTEEITTLEDIQVRYSGNLLRNFTSTFLDNYLKNIKELWKEPKEYYLVKESKNKENRYLAISEVIEEAFTNGYNDSNFEKTLFNEISCILPDRHCVYSFSSEHTMLELREKNPVISNFLNKPIYSRINKLKNNDLQVVSTRFEQNSLIILLRNGYTKNEDDKKAIFFITCEMNFEHNLFIIKFREVFRKNSKIAPRKLIDTIISYITSLFNASTIKVLIEENNESIKKKLFELFSVETTRADALILERLPIPEKELDSKIENFIISNLKLTDDEFYIRNFKKIKSMYCHNVATTIDNSLFNKRHIFAYTFFDGTTTRSITRDSKREHIYARDLYWSLKSTVTKEGKISEISLYYKINKSNVKEEPVGENFLGLEVTFKAAYGGLLINYYTNFRDPERRKKSEFTLFELKKYL